MTSKMSGSSPASTSIAKHIRELEFHIFGCRAIASIISIAQPSTPFLSRAQVPLQNVTGRDELYPRVNRSVLNSRKQVLPEAHVYLVNIGIMEAALLVVQEARGTSQILFSGCTRPIGFGPLENSSEPITTCPFIVLPAYYSRRDVMLCESVQTRHLNNTRLY
jgi:hypothetical protein